MNHGKVDRERDSFAKFIIMKPAIIYYSLVFVLTFDSCTDSLPVGAPKSNGTSGQTLLLINASHSIRVEDFQIPDHLDGVKLERDGHINRKFRREVILGETEVLNNVDQVAQLTSLFRRADTSGDGSLTEQELSTWIARKVKEHLDKAIKGNVFIFMEIDKDRNGLVTWEEYHLCYMLDQGMNETFAKEHKENHKDLPRKVREKILVDNASFNEAIRTNPEGLNIDEFLSFRHPEHSHVTLLNMVQDIFDKLDDNSDDFLSEAEFMAVSQDEIPNKRVKVSEEEWAVERMNEFHTFIDIDHDGKVSRQELMMYTDPSNPAHALTEAKNLFTLADGNRDGKLSLNEVLSHQDIFLGSKMVDIAKQFHDEF